MGTLLNAGFAETRDPKSYAAGLEMCCPGGACYKLSPAILSRGKVATTMPSPCDMAYLPTKLPSLYEMRLRTLE